MSEEGNSKRKISMLESFGIQSMAMRALARTGIVLATVLICVWIVRAMFWTFVDNYQIPYMFDSRTGQTIILTHTGYIRHIPIVQSVHHIDGRPMQVCISLTTIKRVLNCKLVQFNRKGIELFIEWHGRNDYDIDSGQFNELLKNYAYDDSGKQYPFLDILAEIKGGQVVSGKVPAQ